MKILLYSPNYKFLTIERNKQTLKTVTHNIYANCILTHKTWPISIFTLIISIIDQISKNDFTDRGKLNARSLRPISRKSSKISTLAASSAATNSCSCWKIWSWAFRRVFANGACLILVSSDLFNTSTSAGDCVSDPFCHFYSFFCPTLLFEIWYFILSTLNCQTLPVI